MRGDDGVFANAPKGIHIMDSSTISPGASKALSADAKKFGMHYADSPMSGGIGGAEAGTLTFMVGCEDD